MTEVTFKTFDMVLGSSLITDPEAADEIACALGPLFTPRPIAEYDEDMGTVLWWKFPIEEPPYVGSPNDLGHEVVIRPGSISTYPRATPMRPRMIRRSPT
jgi:hypothetical protein